jgi:RNA polymerase sigma factor (TIGR02999 family)
LQTGGRRTRIDGMSDITRILSQVESGDPAAAEQLLPLVYHELRKLAAARMIAERPDHTLQATALVHEAYIRLVDTAKAQHWNSRNHFFSAAAESMRRILVDHARARRRHKRSGSRERVELAADLAECTPGNYGDWIDFSESLDQLAAEDADSAALVKLRVFAGLSVEEAGKTLGMTRTAAYENWKFARAWYTLRGLSQREVPE